MGESNPTLGRRSEDDRNSRLNSWGEIAAYLDRDIRTVQRWEKNEGLPVHRHVHSKRGTVYAYRDELDEWAAERAATSPDPNGPSNPRAGRSDRRILAGAVFVGCVVFAALIWSGVRFVETRTARLDFVEPEWILMTAPEDAVEDQRMYRLFEDALRTELGDSSVLAVVPPTRIADTLALMRRSADTVIDAEIGRKIALRDGDVAAVLEGGIERVGDGYLLTSRLTDPRDEAILAAFSVEVDEEGDSAPAVRDLSIRIRQAAEGRLSARAASEEQRLERVTTDSLEALELYSEAMQLSTRESPASRPDPWPIIEDLLHQAVELDPEFPSAHILLAWAIRNQNFFEGESRELLPQAETAFELADTVTDVERHFIRGSYYHMRSYDQTVGALETAVEEYEMLVLLQPNHYWGINNLVGVLSRLGRDREAAEYAVQRAELWPTGVHFTTAGRLLAHIGEADRAREYYSKSQRSGDRVQGELVYLRKHWLDGDYLGLVEEADRLAGILDSFEPRDALIYYLVQSYAALGQFDKATAVLEKHSSLPVHLYWLAPFGTQQLSPSDDQFPPGSDRHQADVMHRAFWAARAGNVAEAEVRLEQAKDIDDFFPMWSEQFEEYVPIVEAEILRAERAYPEAEERLSAALRDQDRVSSQYFLAAESLAALRERRGDYAGAIQILERWGGQSRTEMGISLYTVFWMRNRAKLALLLRDADPARAAGLEAELGDMLAYADPDHFVLRELQSASSASED